MICTYYLPTFITLHYMNQIYSLLNFILNWQIQKIDVTKIHTLIIMLYYNFSIVLNVLLSNMGPTCYYNYT